MAHDKVVVKVGHWSGVVVQAGRKVLRCLKTCVHPEWSNVNVLEVISTAGCRYSPDSDKPRHCASALLALMARFLSMRFRENKETQYKYVKQGLLVEELLPLTAYTTEGAVEYRFWTVYGSVVYVEVMCGANQYTYVSADFHVLDIEYEVSQPVRMREWEPCVREPACPRNWAHMLHAIKRLTQHVEGLVRMELYSDGRKRIFLSEYTFTPDACNRDDSRPKTAQQLLVFLTPSSRRM